VIHQGKGMRERIVGTHHHGFKTVLPRSGHGNAQRFLHQVLGVSVIEDRHRKYCCNEKRSELVHACHPP
jgi:hypothetical protein